MQIMAHQLWQTDSSAICLTAVPSRVPEEAQITGSENGGWGNTTPYKGSIHFKQLVTVLNTSLFLLLEHFTKATDSPHPFTNRNTRERRDLARVTEPA